jgi:hypothetical protein
LAHKQHHGLPSLALPEAGCSSSVRSGLDSHGANAAGPRHQGWAHAAHKPADRQHRPAGHSQLQQAHAGVPLQW